MRDQLTLTHGTQKQAKGFLNVPGSPKLGKKLKARKGHKA